MIAFIKTGLVIFLVTVLAACGVSTTDYENVVKERDELRAKFDEKNGVLVKVSQELEVKKRELATEIKVKQAHAVREEQAKQRLKQAERDLTSALRELSLCKGKKK